MKKIAKKITVVTNRRTVEVDTASILYVDLHNRKTVIHLSGDKQCETYTPIDRLEQELGDDFLRIGRDCIVAKKAIHAINKSGVNLVNGETLRYTRRRKPAVKEFSCSGKRAMFSGFDRGNVPKTPEEYQKHYAVFDKVPVAFTDIKIIFNEKHLATDWLFCYVNPALERLEKLPKEKLITNSFRTLFPNMDDKWLRAYERTALYGETLEIIDYSPEIDADLRIICFPTFEGHCGCLLFDRSEVLPTQICGSGNQAK